jgi:hypothetical protein
LVAATVFFARWWLARIVGDRKFNADDDLGKRELLAVDATFTGKPGDAMHGENMVLEGVGLHKLEKGSTLRICPASAAPETATPEQREAMWLAAGLAGLCPGALAADDSCRVRWVQCMREKTPCVS